MRSAPTTNHALRRRAGIHRWPPGIRTATTRAAWPHWTAFAATAVLLGSLSCGDGATEPPAATTPIPSVVRVTPATVELSALGDTAQLTADVRDQSGQPMAGAAVTWASGAPGIATVDGQGLVTAVGNGSTTITASAGSVSGSASASVAQEVRAVSVSEPEGPVFVGDTVRLVAESHDANGHAVAGSEFSWASSDTTVATVDASGLVTGLASGEAEVTATSSGATGSVEVAVHAADSVSVSPSKEVVPLGDTLRLVAEALDDNGQPLDGVRFSWSSSRPEVASVNQSGLVTGVAEGSATITATGAGTVGAADIAVTNPDRAALVALYKATDGPNWENNDNWLTDAPLGDWNGVWTDDVGRVVSLGLYGYDLSGTIPPVLGNLSNLKTLDLSSNDLSGAIPPELGNLSNLELLELSSNNLSGAIPPELGDLSNLSILVFWNNELTGPIPPELGNLRSLVYLNLAHNGLEGTIPTSLVGLDLNRFNWEVNRGLCAPAVREFVEWLQGLEDISGPFCNQSDVAALELLFEVAGGSAWTNAEGWFGDPTLDGWHGVRADSLGRVTALDLARNGLAGRLPPQLGNLVNLTELNLGDNALRGRIPRELGNLVNLTALDLSDNALNGSIPRELGNLVNLTEFHYDGTDVCVPSDAALRSWLNGVRDHRGTGVNCTQIGAAELARFFHGNPRVAAAMTWLGTDNRVRPYAEWPQALKDKLVLAVGQLTGGGGTGLPDVMTNQVADLLDDDFFAWTVLSREDAENLYVANIAHALILEMEGGVPWSLNDLSERELDLLLGSGNFFSRYGSVTEAPGVTGYVVPPWWVLPAPPELVREFVAYNDLVGSSRYETIVRAIDWAHNHLVHFIAYYHAGNMEDHWGYRGTAPLARMFSGTHGKYGFEHWTGGCHGTNWFLLHLLRAVNIPVAYIRAGTPHAIPSFPSEGLYLSHGDDPYHEWTKTIPPFPEPFPISEILIDERTFRERFIEPNSYEERLNNLDRRVIELGVKHPVWNLLLARCGDLARQTSNEESVVYRGLAMFWTVEELEAMRLWERMDAKIAKYGGCSKILCATNTWDFCLAGHVTSRSESIPPRIPPSASRSRRPEEGPARQSARRKTASTPAFPH